MVPDDKNFYELSRTCRIFFFVDHYPFLNLHLLFDPLHYPPYLLILTKHKDVLPPIPSGIHHDGKKKVSFVY
jgi:hypothetical protein